MDWTALVSLALTAIVGLAGVCIGGLLAAFPALAVVGLQRRWALDDRRREWRRQRLGARLAPVEEWTGVSLRMLRSFETASDPKFGEGFIGKDAFKQLRAQFKAHEEQDATMVSDVVSLGDRRLTDLVSRFRERRTALLEVLEGGDDETISDKRSKLNAAAAEIHMRAEAMLEETFSGRSVP